jgi:type II secretory ATPase GspE/PulE/Tfp pilus assembly ATPase PilB-like protein
MPTAQPTPAIPADKSLPNGTLADVLVVIGALDKARADQIKLAEIQSGKSQEEIIKEGALVPDSKLVQAKAQLYNIPYVDLSAIPVEPASLASLPSEVAERFKVFPISVDRKEKSLTLAMADPLDLSAIEFIEQKTGLHVKPRAAEAMQITDFIENRYSSSLTQEVTAAMKEVAPERNEIHTLESSKNGFIREEKVAQIVSQILDFAIKSRASDVHIEPQEKSTRVRYRIDGILQEKLTIPHELHDSLVSRIKILGAMKIDERRIPQDGRFNFKGQEEEVDLRISSLPTSWGEKIVMRLLKKSGGVPDLPELGLRGNGLKNLQEAILRPHGIILICGPTGSGKTTTLYSVISKLNTPKVNIVTLEDPIEYKIPGVNQVQINPAVGLTFADGLKSFLRQDPNIILVGEIRDRETADLAIQASLTGHLVFSTLHTNDASGALPRLLDMGAEPYLLSSSITCIVAQRVVRKIHNDCKEAYIPEQKVIEEMKVELGSLWQPTGETKLYKGKGDPECGNSGYFGRVGIFEVIPTTEKISRLILERSSASAINKQAKEEGMISLKQDGYLKVIEGITTVEEVIRVAQE